MPAKKMAATEDRMAKIDAARIAKLDRRIEQLKAQRQAALARGRTAARKLDTRRKIVLGGYVIARAREGDPWAAALLNAMRADLPARERPLFADWPP